MKAELLRSTKLNCLLKAYMQSPKDWKNVEMTGFVKYNNGKSEKKNNPDEFTWYARVEITKPLTRDVKDLLIRTAVI